MSSGAGQRRRSSSTTPTSSPAKRTSATSSTTTTGETGKRASKEPTPAVRRAARLANRSQKIKDADWTDGESEEEYTAIKEARDSAPKTPEQQPKQHETDNSSPSNNLTTPEKTIATTTPPSEVIVIDDERAEPVSASKPTPVKEERIETELDKDLPINLSAVHVTSLRAPTSPTHQITAGKTVVPLLTLCKDGKVTYYTTGPLNSLTPEAQQLASMGMPSAGLSQQNGHELQANLQSLAPRETRVGEEENMGTDYSNNDRDDSGVMLVVKKPYSTVPASQRAEEFQHENLYEHNGLMFCNYCQHQVDHVRRTTVVNHCNSRKHRRAKYLADFGVEMPEDATFTNYNSSIMDVGILHSMAPKRSRLEQSSDSHRVEIHQIDDAPSPSNSAAENRVTKLVSDMEQNQITRLISDCLTKGFKLLNDCCSSCDTVLLESPRGQRVCVSCVLPVSAAEKSPATVEPEDTMVTTLAKSNGEVNQLLDTLKLPENGVSASSSTASEDEEHQPLEEHIQVAEQSRRILLQKMNWCGVRLQANADLNVSLQLCSLLKLCSDTLQSVDKLAGRKRKLPPEIVEEEEPAPV